MNAQTTSDRDKLTAAFGLLDRGWGKPKETHVMESPEGQGLMRIVREIVHVNETRAWCKAKSTLPCKQSAEEPTFETTQA